MQRYKVLVHILHGLRSDRDNITPTTNHTMSYLLQHGTVILHDDNQRVQVVNTDVLIEGNKISKIGKYISGPASAIVIDCTDKIISPGFIDTHHHVWQTQLRGRHADQTFIQYMSV
jgi:cytosine/adenosine deaminase-related metal-dependent hydrolase